MGRRWNNKKKIEGVKKVSSTGSDAVSDDDSDSILVAEENGIGQDAIRATVAACQDSMRKLLLRQQRQLR